MILIVDDYADGGNALARLLVLDGRQATHVTSGGDALRIISDREVTLVLLDLMMPDMDGIDVLRAIRGNPATASIPVLIYSATSHTKQFIEALKAGANDCIPKGFLNYSQILRRIEKHLPPDA